MTLRLIVAGIILAALLLWRWRRRAKIVPKQPVPNTCAWARALYHNKLISMDELNQFMAAHKKCPTCIPEEALTGNS